jgi:hypothetical protein
MPAQETPIPPPADILHIATRKALTEEEYDLLKKTIREHYAGTYAWVAAQPCTSWDFVCVPIESLAELLSASGR